MANTQLLEAMLPPPEGGRCDILLIAGEHSGDEHAARMIEQARTKQPSLKICALGGKQVQKAGAQLLHDLTESSVVGLAEVLRHYSYFKQLFEQTVKWIRQHKPRAVCFVDYPGFNLRLAKRLYQEGIAHKAGGQTHLLYYIAPQIWAWKAKRRFTMAKHLDALGVIFPFEPPYFADTDLPVQFLGHPFVSDHYEPPLQCRDYAPILLLPGSRKQAVTRIFPLMLAGFKTWAQKHKDARACVIYPNESVKTIIENCLSTHPKAFQDCIELIPCGETAAGKAVLTSSGTMSLNCALAGIPGAIVYRANPLTYLIGRWLVKIPYLGIANLLLQESAYPEYLQGRASAKNLAQELDNCTLTSERQTQANANAARIRQLLGSPKESTPGEWLLSHLALR